MTRNPSDSDRGNDEGAELIRLPGSRLDVDAENLEHLAANRRLIIRRSLLATLVGGVIPIPVMDDYVAGRVRAGMLMKLAERRQVDLLLSSAELLADPREATAVRNATMTAATLLALKLAWRKFFAVLAVGRRAEEMAITFQMGTLFDHFCTKIHIGAGIDRARASQLRGIIHASVSDAEKTALTSVFREGGRILGRSMLEAPSWMTNRFERAVEQWMRTGGRPPASDDADPAHASDDADSARWLDRASAAVEGRINHLGSSYMHTLVRSFEQRWRQAEAAAPPAGDKDASKPPPAPPSGATT